MWLNSFKKKKQRITLYSVTWRINFFFSAFATKGLSLVCESYDQKCRTSNSAASGNSSCSILQQCDHILGSTPACYALFGQNKDGGLNTIMKGCITQPAQDCAPSSVCNGQRKSLHNSPALYHCCCTEDKCNRDVIILISEETEKNCVVKGENLFLE